MREGDGKRLWIKSNSDVTRALIKVKEDTVMQKFVIYIVRREGFYVIITLQHRNLQFHSKTCSDFNAIAVKGFGKMFNNSICCGETKGVRIA